MTAALGLALLAVVFFPCYWLNRWSGVDDE